MNKAFTRDINKINEYGHDSIKDLAVILSSENLIDILSPEYSNPWNLENSEKALTALSENYSFQENSIQKRKKLPLGKYAEHLFGEAMKEEEEIEIIYKNLQLNDTERTIGEIDFIVKNKRSGLYYHIEFAQKYYLKTIKENHPIFLGPSKKDWYKNKLRKLLEDQLMITISKKDYLPLDLSKIVFTRIPIMKGSLFYPIEEYDIDRASFKYGWWTDFDQLSISMLSKQHLFQPIYYRKNWIYPFYKSGEFYSAKELLEEVQTNELINNGIMVARYSLEKEAIDRGFLMKSAWPKNI